MGSGCEGRTRTGAHKPPRWWAVRRAVCPASPPRHPLQRQGLDRGRAPCLQAAATPAGRSCHPLSHRRAERRPGCGDRRPPSPPRQLGWSCQGACRTRRGRRGQGHDRARARPQSGRQRTPPASRCPPPPAQKSRRQSHRGPAAKRCPTNQSRGEGAGTACQGGPSRRARPDRPPRSRHSARGQGCRPAKAHSAGPTDAHPRRSSAAPASLPEVQASPQAQRSPALRRRSSALLAPHRVRHAPPARGSEAPALPPDRAHQERQSDEHERKRERARRRKRWVGAAVRHRRRRLPAPPAREQS
mmetsp:Transcript_9321/g.30901  ORF Transcript_9321/g.30901 Transcript_9321/m.30901 type:complete len:301 (-) Transcript_9321:500-1402(-)